MSEVTEGVSLHHLQLGVAMVQAGRLELKQKPAHTYNGVVHAFVHMYVYQFILTYNMKNNVMVEPDKPAISGQWLFRAC